jgi:riboflavin kinase/FMN adenylyltransferase
MTIYTGVVSEGKRRGRELGYPTINIPLHGVSGIYAARVTIDRDSYIAAAFADSSRGVLEAHVLDESGDWYGKNISIELFKKLRESTAFFDDDALRAAIAEDVAQVREYFKN